MGKLLTLILIVLNILAVIDCLKSNKDTGKKALWIIIILILPYVGLILYYFVGKKQ